MRVGHYDLPSARLQFAIAVATTLAVAWMLDTFFGRSAVAVVPVGVTWVFLAALLVALAVRRADS